MPDPVLIVGAGPTGLTAALELSRLGIPVRIVDKLAEPRTTSRAIGVQARTLELLDQRGLAEELLRCGNRAAGTTIYGGGATLVHVDLTRIESRFNTVLLVPQSDTERVLREALERQGVSVQRNVELVGLSQDALSHEPSPARAVLRHPDGGLEAAQAPWVISAEGAHSSVRTTLDLRFGGKTLPVRFALGDLHFDGDLSPSDMHIFSSDHGLLTMFPLGGQHFRLIADVPDGGGASQEGPSLDELQIYYAERSHIPGRLRDLTWSSWFHVNSRMIDRLRVGRLLLGGDAAHIHSPAGGQGMNTGIQDMINLGWKLAMVIKGEAGEALLDTYERDRLPVMRHVLSTTERLTDVAGSRGPVVRGLLDNLAPWVGGLGLVQENAVAQISQTSLGYRDSPLSSNHIHGGDLRAGDRVPDFAVRVRRDGAWRDAGLASVLDPSRFVLLLPCPDEVTPPPSALEEAVRPWPDIVAVAAIAPAGPEKARFHAVFGRHPTAVLVRPDAYVGLCAGEHSAPRHLAEYCGRWFAAKAA